MSLVNFGAWSLGMIFCFCFIFPVGYIDPEVF